MRAREYFGMFCGNAGSRPLSTIVDDLLSRQSLFLTGCYFHDVWSRLVTLQLLGFFRPALLLS